MPSTTRIQRDNKSIRKVTNLSIVTNLVLSAIKIIVGLLGGSLALIADGFHSLSDLLTDFTVLIGIHYGAKEPDSEHPYGHGRAETFSSALIAAVLFLVGGAMIYKAALSIPQVHVQTPGFTTIIAACISIVVKEILFRITKKVSIKTDSTLLYANAWHHRSDALSSVVVLVGIIFVLAGFNSGDHIAAVLVGLMIVLVGWRILVDCFNEFAESSVDKGTIKQIENIINSNEQILNWHNLRTRIVGREVFLDLHILVDPLLNITQAHDIAEELENTLHSQISRPVNVIIHIEPNLEQS